MITRHIVEPDNIHSFYISEKRGLHWSDG
jgi:hypothetical protein